jgi:hypothetical protein
MSGAPLPVAFFEVLKLCKDLLSGRPEEQGVDVALAVARLVQLSSQFEKTAFTDDRSTTDTFIQQLLVLEATYRHLEDRLSRAYPFTLNQGPYPPVALFQRQWHSYNGIWGARIWNHFRWASILLNEIILKCIASFPKSSQKFISTVVKKRCMDVNRRMAEDILISVPSHWHHPILDDKTAKGFEAPGQGGSGAAGVPTLLWHLKIAANATGASQDVWDWAYDIMQVVWKEMGMKHALSLAEVMEQERVVLEKERLDRTLKVESPEYA